MPGTGVPETLRVKRTIILDHPGSKIIGTFVDPFDFQNRRELLDQWLHAMEVVLGDVQEIDEREISPGE